ncbi:MAG: prepilin peptidase [Cyanobacteria bacterium NC_groundwater_1444_Ag_S-0.65um_54_12]|nr:prepilin peptidase [Cyanobacteria bacterium NC_groundwater_1444_Ag_S-0.65um_54_12]
MHVLVTHQLLGEESAVESWKWGLVPLLLIAVYTDWRWQKIFNWLTFPAILLGLLLAALTGLGQGGLAAGSSAILSALAGAGLMIVIFFLLLQTGGMKAGDLKLMTAVGAWLGWPLALSALVDVFLAGGVLALSWAIAHRALGRTIRQVRDFFWALAGGMAPQDLLPESAAPLFPYGIAIAAGTILAMLLPPLLPWEVGQKW